MATLKHALSHLSDKRLVATAAYVISKLTENAVIFPTPEPSVAVLTVAMEDMIKAITAAEDGGRSAHTAKRKAYRTLKSQLNRAAHYVGLVADGDEATILAGGFYAKKTAEPTTTPQAPVLKQVRTSAYQGQVILRWRTMQARYFTVYATQQDPSTGEAQWSNVGTTTKCSYTVENLASRQWYWFKVVATNTAGASPYSTAVSGRAA